MWDRGVGVGVCRIAVGWDWVGLDGIGVRWECVGLGCGWECVGSGCGCGSV